MHDEPDREVDHRLLGHVLVELLSALVALEQEILVDPVEAQEKEEGADVEQR